MHIVPSKSLGPFVLGNTLRECVTILQHNSRDFKQVRIHFNLNNEANDETLLWKSDIIIDLASCGIYLRFDHYQQRLRMIDIYDLSKIPIYYHKKTLTHPSPNINDSTAAPLSYDTKSGRLQTISDTISASIADPIDLSNASATPTIDDDDNKSTTGIVKSSSMNTFAHIYNVMGLTYPGRYDDKRRLYCVEYPGIWFAFHLDENPGIEVFPVEWKNETSPPLRRIIVFNGDSISQTILPALSQTIPYFEPIIVTLNEGILLGWRERKVNFGSSVEDVLTDVGPPDRIFYKLRKHIMPIQKASQQTLPPQPRLGTPRNSHTGLTPDLQPRTPPVGPRTPIQRATSTPTPTPPQKYHRYPFESSPGMKKICGARDYFFNYITLGLDILFDGYTHCVKKMVLHTNQVIHPDFNRWCKCNFLIQQPSKLNGDHLNCIYPMPNSMCSQYVPGYNDEIDAHCIHSCSQMKDIISVLGPPQGAPLMFKSSQAKEASPDELPDDADFIPSKNHHGSTTVDSVVTSTATGEGRLRRSKLSHSARICAYRGALFEITQNESIATVTLFYDPDANAAVNVEMNAASSILSSSTVTIDSNLASQYRHARINTASSQQPQTTPTMAEVGTPQRYQVVNTLKQSYGSGMKPMSGRPMPISTHSPGGTIPVTASSMRVNVASSSSPRNTQQSTQMSNHQSSVLLDAIASATVSPMDGSNDLTIDDSQPIEVAPISIAVPMSEPPKPVVIDDSIALKDDIVSVKVAKASQNNNNNNNNGSVDKSGKKKKKKRRKNRKNANNNNSNSNNDSSVSRKKDGFDSGGLTPSGTGDGTTENFDIVDF